MKATTSPLAFAPDDLRHVVSLPTPVSPTACHALFSSWELSRPDRPGRGSGPLAEVQAGIHGTPLAGNPVQLSKRNGQRPEFDDIQREFDAAFGVEDRPGGVPVPERREMSQRGREAFLALRRERDGG